MRLFLILLAFYFISCDNNSIQTVSGDTTLQGAKPDTTSLVHYSDTSKSGGTKLYVWQIDYEHKTKTKNPMFRDEYLTVDTIIKGLNQAQPKIQLDKIKFSNDTLYTQIKDSYYLGESIGSYGANAYIADAVINLTSVKNISYVKIDFEDGSHISPGTWSKKEFENYTVR
jgi:hypothetical protein